MSIQKQEIEPETRALIYCRVSGTRQKIEGHGLESQEHRCRQYADSRGYGVEAVFPDDVTGGGDFMKRPGMVALLSYLDAQNGRDKDYVVIFDDLKRFARNTEFHIQLRRAFKVRNARVECLNFKFEDTPEGKFVETIVAAQGELEREQNRRQVLQKMRARVETGYWVFQAPIGYRYAEIKGHGKLLVRDEPYASILAEAFEGYASGRFETQAEVKRFLESQPEYPKDLPSGEIRAWRITKLLSNILYTGHIEVPKWKLPLQEGQHEGLITLETHRKIQDRMAGKANAPARKDISADFPLRGFVVCGDCDHPMTSCWSKGKYKKYPYYFCDRKECDSYRRSIPRAKIEEPFEELLKDLQPAEGLFTLVRHMFKDAWDQRLTRSAEMLKGVSREMRKVERQIDGLLDRIVEAANPSVASAYEKRIAKLELDKATLAERRATSGKPQRSFEEMFELSMKFLSNPQKLWASGQLHLQKTVLRLAFAERIAYCRNEGLRTPKIAMPFKALEGFSGDKSLVVPHR